MSYRNLFASFLCAFILFAVPAFAGITVTSPANGSTVSSPVHVVASASSSNPIAAMRVYVDNVSVYLTYSNSIDTYITLSSGGHFIVVQSWDSTGLVTKFPLNVTVAAQSNARVFSDIEDMTGWEACDICSGAGGNGATTPH